MKKMSWTRKAAIFAFLALLLLPLQILSAQSAQNQVGHMVLPNGLEVFVAENHSVPLVTVCVAFRGGASAQTPETAGLFHLYEHMMFAGNAKFPTKESFNAALNSMGTTAWNGATGTEYINYYITVPSEKTEAAVEFWAQAVRNPLFDPAVLENEKNVVLNEIKGYHADPARIAANALESRMFKDYPWRKNIDGPEYNIQSATVQVLKQMQSRYYVPENMALMVGGDCTMEEVKALAEQYFGDWKGQGAPSFGVPPHGKIPAGINLVSVEDQFYRGIGNIQFRWRGPDVLAQTQDTYTSDVLLFLLSSPIGRFKDSIMKKVEGLYDAEYIDFTYPTARDGGNYIFSTYMLIQKPAAEGAVLDRVMNLKNAVLDEFKEIARDPAGYFGSNELQKAKTKLIDQNIFAMESAETFVTDTLTFWWSTATADYFFGYEKNCSKVSWDDIRALVQHYITGSEVAPAPEIATMLRIRTSTFGSDSRMAAKMQEYGFEKVNADNAFWWQR